MDGNDQPHAPMAYQDIARFSETRRHSPQVNPGLRSPVQSVHPDMHGALDSFSSQSDVGMRTLDFLDDTSEEGDSIYGAQRRSTYAANSEGAPARRRGGKTEDEHVPVIPMRCARRIPAIDRSAVVAEIARYAIPIEDAPSQIASSTVTAEHVTEPEKPASTPKRSSPRLSDSRHKTRAVYEAFEADRKSHRASNASHVFGAHALAHEITLQALMRDQITVEHSLQTLQPVYSSVLSAVDLRAHDPRSPSEASFPGVPHPLKCATVIPPPIDTSSRKRPLPLRPLRTPYPDSPRDLQYRKLGLGPAPFSFDSPRLSTESMLILTIRRSHQSRRSKVRTLAIPNPSGRVTATLDDEALFLSIRKAYAQLTGTLARRLSARCLSRIVVSGPASRAADMNYGWLHSPRSPRILAWKGLTDSFSEHEIMQHYKNPRLGRTRVAFVQWAHRLAAAPSRETSCSEEEKGDVRGRQLVRRGEQPEGLEFIVSWSVRRIALVFALILVFSLAAALLWIFLGKGGGVPGVNGLPEDGHNDSGYRHAADRLGTGLILGISVLMVESTCMAGWLGLSWLIL